MNIEIGPNKNIQRIAYSPADFSRSEKYLGDVDEN